jgi:DJ-1 family protein
MIEGVANPKAAVILVDGVEEMEAVIVIDTLRRAEWNVVSVGLADGIVAASRGVKLVPDAVWSEADFSSFDVLVLPGGIGGVQAICADSRVLSQIRLFMDDDAKTLAAICAAPLALQEAGVLEGRTYTSHPGVAKQLHVGNRVADRVVVDGLLITSQGPGTSFEFALKLVEQFDATGKASALAEAMVL